MSVDAIALMQIAREQNVRLCGAKITKINQIGRDEIVLSAYCGEKLYLKISAGASANRFHLTDSEPNADERAQAAGFCLLLRKHLSGATIESISAQHFERLIEIEFNAKLDLGYEAQRYLITELTGKSANIFLTDENKAILGSIKPQSAALDSGRLLIVGAKHTSLDSRGRFAPDENQKIKNYLLEARAGGVETAKHALENCLGGVSPQTLNEIFTLGGADFNSLENDNIEKILSGLHALLANLQQPAPNIVYDKNGRMLSVLPFDYKSVRGEKKFFETLNDAHQEFYSQSDKKTHFSQKTKSLITSLKNALSRLDKKMAIHRQTLEDAKNAEILRQNGELLIANLWQIKAGATTARVTNFYAEDAAEIVIGLDGAKSAQENAQEYFKKYRKLKASARHAETLLDENVQRARYYKSVLMFLGQCSDEATLADITAELEQDGLIKPKTDGQKPRKKVGGSVKKGGAQAQNSARKILAKPRKFICGGYTVFAGRSNTQNAELTFNVADGGDIWLHAQGCGGAHVIILQRGQAAAVDDKTLQIAAEIAAFYSENGAGKAKCAIDYTLKKEIKKPPKSALGFVIYNTYKTLIVYPDAHNELAVD